MHSRGEDAKENCFHICLSTNRISNWDVYCVAEQTVRKNILTETKL